RRLIGDSGAAALALVLFLLGGSLGWLLVAGDLNASHNLWSTLLHHAWDQGRQNQANFQWQNMFFSFLAPQRAYLYGIPLALLTCTLLFAGVQGGTWRLFLAAGLVAGLLPLAHLSTLVALALATPFLCLLFPSRRWAGFFAAWALVAAPQLLLQQGGLHRGATA